MRAAVAVAAAVALAAATGVVAAPPGAGYDQALTITGSRTAYALVTVKKWTQIDFKHATVVKLGAYGGVAFGNDGFAIASDEVPEVNLSASPSRMTWNGFHYWGVQPGTYRVYLISDGAPVRVRLPWSAADAEVEATTPVDVGLRIERRTVLDSDWQVLMSNVGAKNSYVYAVAHYAARGATERDVWIGACISRRPHCDGERLGFGNRSRASLGGIGVGVARDTDSPGWHVVGRFTKGERTPLDDFVVVTLRVPLTKWCRKGRGPLYPCRIG